MILCFSKPLFPSTLTKSLTPGWDGSLADTLLLHYQELQIPHQEDSEKVTGNHSPVSYIAPPLFSHSTEE